MTNVLVGIQSFQNVPTFRCDDVTGSCTCTTHYFLKNEEELRDLDTHNDLTTVRDDEIGRTDKIVSKNNIFFNM